MSPRTWSWNRFYTIGERRPYGGNGNDFGDGDAWASETGDFASAEREVAEMGVETNVLARDDLEMVEGDTFGGGNDPDHTAARVVLGYRLGKCSRLINNTDHERTS